MTTDTPILPKRPSTTADLARVVADAGPGVRVRVQGSASVPVAPPASGGPTQLVSTLRMNTLIEHAVSDMTVIVHAGMTLEQLQRQLAWQDQWLPLDPPAMGGRSPGTRTLGGLVATNALGPLRMGFGDWRTHLLGVRWVDATGAVIKGGGRTVKNVAGYSTPRMLIGSRGGLGVIAELTLRTHARPADEQAAVFYCPTAAAADALVGEVLLADLEPAYVQTVAAAGFDGNTLGLPAPAAGRPVVIVGFMGRPEVCAAQVARARDLPAARGTEAIGQGAAPAGRLRLWMTSEPPAAAVTFRLYTLSSRVAEAVAAVEALAGRVGAKPFVVAEAVHGVVRGGLSGDGVDVEKAVDGLRTIANACEAVLETWPGTGREVSALEGRIKAQIDPQGRFVGG